MSEADSGQGGERLVRIPVNFDPDHAGIFADPGAYEAALTALKWISSCGKALKP